MDLRHAAWRKASYSAGDNNCVEVASLPGTVALRDNWRKASYSNGDNNCVEATTLPGIVAIRDSKDRTGPALTFTPAQWQDFAARLQPGRGA